MWWDDDLFLREFHVLHLSIETDDLQAVLVHLEEVVGKAKVNGGRLDLVFVDGIDDQFTGCQQLPQRSVGENHAFRALQLRAICTNSRTPTPTPPREV